MVELAYKAFRVSSYSDDPENGFTESEMEIVLFDFLHYCMTLQKKTSSTPTTTPSSDGIGSKGRSTPPSRRVPIRLVA